MLFILAAMAVAEINLIYAKNASGVKESIFFLLQALVWYLIQIKALSKALEISEGRKISIKKLLLFELDEE